jgi:hypothetical protein
MDSETRAYLVMFLIAVLLFVGILTVIGGLEYYHCKHLGQKTEYNTAWVFPSRCFVEYNGIWYPDTTLYKVLGQDFQYDLDANLELELED